MKIYAMTDVGRKREVNQDFVYVTDKPVGPFPNLLVVADGMGGHKAGEVASRYSVEIFKEFINSKSDEELEEDNILDTMVEAVSVCNQKLYEKSMEYENL